MADSVSKPNSPHEATRFQISRQTSNLELQNDMDEASQQILHEHRHAEAKAFFNMKTESSTPGSRHSNNSDVPSTPTMLSTDFKSPQSQGSDGGPTSALQLSLLAGKFSDLTVKHGEQKWKAHKVVVCSQSTILESMITDEGPTSVVDLKEYPAAAISHLLQYLYTNSYTTRDIAPDFALHSHVRVFNLATRLVIPALQAFAEERFRYALNNHVTDLQVYFSNVKQIYTTTPREHPGLRNAVVEAAVTEMKTLLDNENVKNPFLEVLREVPEFHTDILRFLADDPNRPVQVVIQHLCDECGPSSEEKKYILDTECRGCGKMKSMEFY